MKEPGLIDLTNFFKDEMVVINNPLFQEKLLVSMKRNQ